MLWHASFKAKLQSTDVAVVGSFKNFYPTYILQFLSLDFWWAKSLNQSWITLRILMLSRLLLKYCLLNVWLLHFQRVKCWVHGRLAKWLILLSKKLGNIENVREKNVSPQSQENSSRYLLVFFTTIFICHVALMWECVKMSTASLVYIAGHHIDHLVLCAADVVMCWCWSGGIDV